MKGFIKQRLKTALNEEYVIDKYGDKLKTDKSWGDLKFPVSEYKTRVKDFLVHIIMEDRGVSEKSFKAFDEIISEVKDFFINNDAMTKLIKEYEAKKARPEYVAEKIYNEHYNTKEDINESTGGDFIYRGYNCKIPYFERFDSYGCFVYEDDKYIFGMRGPVGSLKDARNLAIDSINRMISRGSLNESTKKSKFAKLEDNKVPLTDEEREKVMNADAVWHHGPNGTPSPAVWKSKNPKTGKITYITHTHRAYNTAPTLKGAIGRYHDFIKGTS